MAEYSGIMLSLWRSTCEIVAVLRRWLKVHIRRVLECLLGSQSREGDK